MIYLQIPLVITAGFFSVYLFALTILAFKYKTGLRITIKKWNRFAVLIPAHNEELVIHETIKNIFNINYPYNLFDVYVVADNCTDKTSIISAKAGALVLERTNKQLKGKGYALKWSLELLLKNRKRYDAFLIIDADTIVSGNILEVMNSYINNGASSIQCSDMVMPALKSWSSEITRVGLMLYNYVKPLGKKVIGFSAGLRGNGMCFTAKLLKNNPWCAYSQTEDLEYGINLLMKGTKTVFAPEATVNAVMPVNAANAESQRARWEIGRIPVIKKYSKELLTAALKNKSVKLFDAFVDLISPAFVNLFCFTVLMAAVNVLLVLLSIPISFPFLILWLAFLLMQVFHVLGGLKIAGADKNAYRALFNVPRYAVWKFLLYIKLTVKGHSVLWVRTARDSETGTILH